MLTNGNQRVKNCLGYWLQKPNYVDDIKTKLKNIVPCIKNNYVLLIYYKNKLQEYYDNGNIQKLTDMLYSHLWHPQFLSISYLAEPKLCANMLF